MTPDEVRREAKRAVQDAISRGSATRLRHKKTPASASAPGRKGQIVYDDDYIYVCIDTDTWTRSAISTW